VQLISSAGDGRCADANAAHDDLAGLVLVGSDPSECGLVGLGVVGRGWAILGLGERIVGVVGFGGAIFGVDLLGHHNGGHLSFGEEFGDVFHFRDWLRFRSGVAGGFFGDQLGLYNVYQLPQWRLLDQETHCITVPYCWNHEVPFNEPGGVHSNDCLHAG